MSEFNPDSSASPVPASPAPAPIAPESELAQLRNQCADLESQAHTLKVVVLLVVVTLCLFFWREASYNGYAAAQMQPQMLQATQYAEFLNKQNSSYQKQMQGIQSALAHLIEYAKTHPDYVPILTKFGVPVQSAAPAAANSTTPAPAVPKK
jgi:hypothetical protein